MKQITKSLLIIGAVLIALGAGTFAWFSDTETSTGNTFTAGTLDLKIRAPDNDESVSDDPGGEDDNPGDFAAATWVISNITPGANAFCISGATDCVGGDKVSGKVRLRNPGTLAGDHLEAQAQLSLAENPVESDTVGDSTGNEMARKLRFLTLSWNGNNCLSSDDDNSASWCRLGDNDSDGTLALNDLTYPNALDDMKPVPPSDSDLVFIMVIRWTEDSSMPGLGYTVHCGNNLRLCDNAFQGDGLTTTITFTLNQDSTQ